MVEAKDLNYNDMRIAQKEDLYFQKKVAEKKQKLMQEMLQTVKDTQKMKNEMNEGFEKFLKNWREKNGENS